MTAYSRTRKKINQWEQQFGEETGLDVAENRREFWRWLEANGYETYGLLDQPRAEAEEAPSMASKKSTSPMTLNKCVG